MRDNTAIIQALYEAFGRGDVPGILAHLAEDVEWEFVGSPGLGYAGKRRGHAGVVDFFATLAKLDAIEVFEPREFIAADGHVTVLGWEKTTTLDTQKHFESEWVHLFTLRNEKVTRWKGFFNTAARYGF